MSKSKVTLSNISKRAANEIISDLCGRSGGDHFFEGADDDIQEEIRETWTDIILKAIEKATS